MESAKNFGNTAGMVIKGAFMAFLLFAGMLSAALSVESYTVTPSSLNPGGEGTVTFTIKNVLPSTSTTSVSPLEDVSVYYSSAPGIEFKSKSPFIVGTIDSGGSSLVTIPFRVLPSAKGGVTTASFYISQKDKTDLKTVNVGITVVNEPILSLSTDHQTLLPTDILNLTITNNGGAASKVYLKMSVSNNFTFIGTTQVYVGDVDAGKSITLKVPIDSRNVREGVNEIPFVVFYQQEGGTSRNETKYLSIAVKKEKADVVFEQIAPIVTSQEDMLELRVKNTGKQTLDDLRIYLEDSNIKAKENKQVKIGTFAPGESARVSFKVFAESEPGVRNTKFVLKWLEENVEKEEEMYVPIVVNSDADAAVFLDAKPTPLVVGSEHTLSVLVSNIGSYKIQNVEVALQNTGTFDILNAQQSQYIGGLESDDFSTVQYKIRIANVAPGYYPIIVGIRYKDQSGVWVEKNVTNTVLLRTPEEAAGTQSGDGGILMGFAVLVIAAGGVWWWRNRSKAKKNGKQ